MDPVSPISRQTKFPTSGKVPRSAPPPHLSSPEMSPRVSDDDSSSQSGGGFPLPQLVLERKSTPRPGQRGSSAPRPSALRRTDSSPSGNTMSSASESHSQEAVQQQIWGLAKEKFELLQFLFDVASILSLSAAILCTIPNVLMVTVVALTVISHLFAEPTAGRLEEDLQPSGGASPVPSEPDKRSVSFAPLPPPVRPVNIDQPCPWNTSRLEGLLGSIKVGEGLELTEEIQRFVTLSVTRAIEFLAAVGLKNRLTRFDATYYSVTCSFPSRIGARRKEADDLSFGPFKISTAAKSIRDLRFCFSFSQVTGQVSALVSPSQESQFAYFVVTNTETSVSHHVEKIEFDPANNEIRIFGKLAPSSGSSSPGSWEHISETRERTDGAPRSPSPSPSPSPERAVRETEVLYTTNFEEARVIFSRFIES